MNTTFHAELEALLEAQAVVEAQYAQFEAEQEQQPAALLRALLAHPVSDDIGGFLDARYPVNDDANPKEQFTAFFADVERIPAEILPRLIACLDEAALCDFLDERYPMAD